MTLSPKLVNVKLDLQYSQVSFIFCMMSKHLAKVQRNLEVSSGLPCFSAKVSPIQRHPRCGFCFPHNGSYTFFRLPGKAEGRCSIQLSYGTNISIKLDSFTYIKYLPYAGEPAGRYPTELRDQYFNSKHALLPKRGKGKCFFQSRQQLGGAFWFPALPKKIRPAPGRRRPESKATLDCRKNWHQKKK